MSTRKKVHIHRSYHTIQGQREHQEDRITIESPLDIDENLHFFCVFDGHGGKTAVEFCKENMVKILKNVLVEQQTSGRYDIQNALFDTVRILTDRWDDQSLGAGKRSAIVDETSRSKYFDSIDLDLFTKRGGDSGTTVCCVVYDASLNVLYIANLGDSRCVVEENSIITETKDHSVADTIPEDMKNLPYTFTVADGRIEDDLAMSRAVGDNTPKLLGVIGRKPDIYKKQLKKDGYCRMILATDGLFDRVSPQDLFLQNHEAASEYIDAIGKEETFDDNTSIIYVTIKWV
jgi:protein phosphatase 2C family protein 2/3